MLETDVVAIDDVVDATIEVVLVVDNASRHEQIMPTKFVVGFPGGKLVLQKFTTGG